MPFTISSDGLQIFDYLKKTDPAQLDKLVAIPGDIMQPELGISSKDRAILEEEVSIVWSVWCPCMSLPRQ